MKTYTKHDFPTDKIRRFLEPGPIVLLSSQHKGETNIMTHGWHTMLEFTPARIGCMISSANHSYELILRSKELVINIPEAHLARTVVGIGNCHSDGKRDKFAEFELTAIPAETVSAPLIAECYANFECKVTDTSLLEKYGLFILEVQKAHAPKRPKYPQTLHYTGDGVFMVSGKHVNYAKHFRPENL